MAFSSPRVAVMSEKATRVRAVRQRLGAPLRQPAVGNLDLAELRRAGQRIGVGDARLELGPEAAVVDQRQAQFGDSG